MRRILALSYLRLATLSSRTSIAALLPSFGVSSSASQSSPLSSASAMKAQVPVSSNSALEDAKAFNAFASASVDITDVHLSRTGLLTLIRSVRDIDSGNKRRRYLYHIPLTSTSLSLPPVELSSDILARIPSPTGDKIAIFRDETTAASEEGGKPQQVLEIWSNQGQALLRRIALPPKLHGKLVFDSDGFGEAVWDNDETAIIYLAERKSPECVSFFEGSFDEHMQKKADDDGCIKHRGGKFTLGLGKTEKWGEKYANQAALLDFFVVDVATGNIGKVDNVPGVQDVSLGGYTLGQPTFSPDGLSIAYTAWDAGGGLEMPRRLGLIYCQQRASKVYLSSIRKLRMRLASLAEPDTKAEVDQSFLCLTPELRLARSPLFAPVDEEGNSKLVFMSSEKGFDTHFGCFGLGVVDWSDGEHVPDSYRTLVDTVWDPRNSPAGSGTVLGMLFPGLFLLRLKKQPFLSPHFLLVTTQWGSCSRIVRISLNDGSISVLNSGGANHYSDDLLCSIPSGAVVFAESAPNQVPNLLCAPSKALISTMSLIEEDLTRLRPMDPIAASKFSAVPKLPVLSFTCDINMLDTPPEIEGVQIRGIPVQTILLLPDRNKHPKPPLIVIPHGGPHSVSSTIYLPSTAFMCEYAGYALALVNYRGSIGFGQGLVESLPTRIGSMDVKDVIEATLKIKESGLVDPSRIGICGGSHGGFLTGHCTGQHPDLFRAAVMRNPVTNLPSMVTATDIPDWVFVECLGSYDWQEYRTPTPEELQRMWELSPSRYVQHVMAPTLVALGLCDLRVPPSQGLEWYYTLRAKGVVCKLLTYDDNDHAIGGSYAEADHWVNIKQWFDQHL